MAHPLFHSISSAKLHGGKFTDYIKYHEWYDSTKAHFPDMRHRALRHHTEGIFLAEQIFGPYITNSDGKMVPTRTLGEQHVMEDLGRVPTVQDWLSNMQMKPWMMRPGEGRKAEQSIRENKEDYAK